MIWYSRVRRLWAARVAMITGDEGFDVEELEV